MTRVAVIGAGVVGAAIAWRLAEEGYPVTLIDPRPGGIASRGSFDWLNAASAEDDHYCFVRQRSPGLWRRLATEHPGCPLAFPGMLLWEVPRDQLEAMAGRLRRLGLCRRAALRRPGDRRARGPLAHWGRWLRAGRAPDLDLAPYRPDRPAVGGATA